ncbi:MAG: thiaminase II [Muribaculaceae bacterium]|nr:thiaminase II [Muribaculaceae bacterium]
MSAQWSDGAWTAAAPIYDKILTHPFVIELARGTLPPEKFTYYLRQDSLYLDNYARVLAHIASRLNDKKHVEDFMRFAIDGIEVEKAMHAVFLDSKLPARGETSPACMLYTSVLGACATLPAEVEAAAVLPCFWIYEKVGKHIMASAGADNPYRQWIDTYGDATFEASTRRAIKICDELADKASTEVRQMMTDKFVTCTKMEWLFWDSAYNLEQWKI